MARFPWFRRRRAVVLITVHVNSPLQPVHRGRLVEDPLLAALAAEIEGVDIIDAGSQLDDEYRLVSCDVVFAVPPIAAHRAGRLLTTEADKIGLTRGSSVTIQGLESTPVGRMRGVRVRLPELIEVDGEDHEHVLFASELTRLVNLLGERLDALGTVWSWRIREDLGSDITIHGRDGDAIVERVTQVLESEPTAKGLTVEVFA